MNMCANTFLYVRNFISFVCLYISVFTQQFIWSFHIQYVSITLFHALLKVCCIVVAFFYLSIVVCAHNCVMFKMDLFVCIHGLFRP